MSHAVTDFTATPTFPAIWIMERWVPASQDQPWTWNDEYAEVNRRLTFPRLLEDIRRDGQVLVSVHLGDDGRVWDGHHRILAAHILNLWVPVEFADPSPFVGKSFRELGLV